MPATNPSPEAETARHYGNMRFAMFTVFTGITGALLAFPFAAQHGQFLAEPLHKTLLTTMGFVLSALFALAEYRISYLVVFYQEAAFKASALAKPDGHDFWQWIVTLTMVMPYLFSGLFWLLYGFGVIDMPIIDSE